MRIEKELLKALDNQQTCIWIKTVEEADFISNLIKLITRKYACNDLYTWSLASGVTKIDLTPQANDEIILPNTAIEPVFRMINDTIKDSNNSNSVKKNELYILKDLHLVIDRPNVIRGIRDIYENFRGKPNSYTPIIVISPVVQIPHEIEHLFTVIEYDTPTELEIRTILTGTSTRLISKGLEPIPVNKLESLIKAFRGFTLRDIKSIILESIKEYNTVELDVILRKKVELIKKTEILSYKIPSNSLSDVGGNDTFKEWVEELEVCMTPEAKEFGIKEPKGYLALGIPGTSKTFMAEALAGKLGMPFLKLDMAKIVSRFAGETERNMAKALKLAQSCSPCVLLIDEVEKALGGYKSSNASDSGAIARAFGNVLEFLNDSKGVFTIMTSNDVSQLPPELTRSGRLDAMWYFSLPTQEERKEIFEVHLRKVNKAVNEDILEEIAGLTNEYTGAEIEQVVKSALRKAYLNKVKNNGTGEITIEELKSAKELVVPIALSSREKIQSLERWAKGRALYSNKQNKTEEVLVDDIEIDLDI